MSVSSGTAVTARHLAIAATVAALSILGATQISMPGEAQEPGMAMPENCQQNLDQCSLKVWAHNTFPHRGSQQSITFSNGATLTCTSNGPNTLRSCTLGVGRDLEGRLGDPNTEAQDALNALKGTKNPTLAQCAALKQSLHDMEFAQDNQQPAVDALGAYLKRAMQMTPAMLDAEIKRQQHVSQLKDPSGRSAPNPELDFLLDLRSSMALPMGGATPEQMQARAARMVKDAQLSASHAIYADQDTIEALRDQIDSLDCAHVAVPGQ